MMRFELGAEKLQPPNPLKLHSDSVLLAFGGGRGHQTLEREP